MIISRAPFRVSLCGGGSDIPSFYEKYGGCVISTTIKKYMYIAIHPSFYSDEIVLKYSVTERVKNYQDIDHKIYRATLSKMNIKGVEITSMADIPSGTGLGSSSAFTVALLLALHTYQNKFIAKYKLACEACDIEIKDLGNPIGKQDQFASAFGGLNYYEFTPSGFVKVEPVVMKPESYAQLERNLLLFYTGKIHDANKILAEQTDNIKKSDGEVKSLIKLTKLTKKLKEELSKNNIDYVGKILKESWEIKKELASGISTPFIDKYYEKALRAGASGGKLLGAGGGGFLLFYAKEEKQAAVRKALKDLREMKFEFDNSGASIVHI
ncbi:MAG: GHMP kinase [Bacilli bacterium]|jgi:D-glycero-alpha-D-manno-heptose-7-phosphate kinase